MARQVPRPGVAHRDRGVWLQKQEGGRLTDEIAPAHDDRLSAFDLNARAVEQLDDAGRRAWLDAARKPECDKPGIDGMESVDILDGVESPGDASHVDLSRRRLLDADPAHALVGVQDIDEVQQLL